MKKNIKYISLLIILLLSGAILINIYAQTVLKIKTKQETIKNTKITTSKK